MKSDRANEPAKEETAPTEDAPHSSRSIFRLLLVLMPLAAFAGLAVMFYFRLGAGDSSQIPSALIGKQMPAISLPSLEGMNVPALDTSHAPKDQPIVINVFASWCAPCRMEHPELMALKNRGVAVLGLGYKDSPEKLRSFLQNFGNPYSAIGVDVSGRTAIELGVYGVPETFVVAPDGKILARFAGAVTVDKVLAAFPK